MITKEQRFLLDNGINDLVVKGGLQQDPKKWVYVSDVLALFSKAQNPIHNIDYAKRLKKDNNTDNCHGYNNGVCMNIFGCCEYQHIG